MSTLGLLDYIMIAFLAWGALVGLRRGLLAIVAGLAGVLLAWYLAARFSPGAAHWLEANTNWVSGMAHFLAGRIPLPAVLASQSLAGLTAEQVSQLVAGLPFHTLLQRPLTDAAVNALMRAAALHLATLGDLVYYSMALLVWTVISFFVIMAVTNGVVNGFAWGLTRSVEGTPLSGLNHLAGGLLGAAENLITLVVLAGLLAPLLQLVRWPGLEQFLAASHLLPVFSGWFHRWSPWKVF